MQDHDYGDEDDIETHPRRFWPKFYFLSPVSYWPRTWFEERLPTAVNHDPGDAEAEWAPLSDVSAMRVAKKLGLRRLVTMVVDTD